MWLLLALFAAIVWGLDYALAERLFRGRVSPLTLLSLQMLAGTAWLLPVALARGMAGEVRRACADTPTAWQLAVAVAGFALGNLLVAGAIKAKDATLASLVEISYPLPVIVFSWILFRSHHLSLSVVVGGVLIAAGIVCIYWFN